MSPAVLVSRSHFIYTDIVKGTLKSTSFATGISVNADAPERIQLHDNLGNYSFWRLVYIADDNEYLRYHNEISSADLFIINRGER